MDGEWMRDELDRPHEECGVFGAYAPGEDVARLAFFALFSLQHRGQESAGIATSDGRTAFIHKGMGLVPQVFNEANLALLRGHLAIAHNRYSTTGSSNLLNAQPYLIDTAHGPLGVAHNGNLTNADKLRQRLLERGVGLSSTSDSEVITQMLAAPTPDCTPAEPNWESRISNFMAEAEGAYSLVILTRDAIFAVRDPLGMRPLCIGTLPRDSGDPGYCVASESCAFGTIGGDYLRGVQPGEIVRLNGGGLQSTMGVPQGRTPALCVFEYVYFARPDSVFENQTIYQVRRRLGAELSRESPVEADVVMGVPDSARPAAVGYAKATGLPYSEGLIKNRYIGRTFIQPSDRLRRDNVALKFNPVTTSLAGKRVIMIDDSIVRGTTAGPLVRLLRKGGAKEVHVRVSSPPVRNPCFMGVDMPTHSELIAHNKTIDEIRQHIGADSLAYLSVEGMMRAVRAGLAGRPHGHCAACFDGNYPVNVTGEPMKKSAKLLFEVSGED